MRSFALLVLAAGLTAADARPETVSILAAQDNTLYGESGAESNGAGDHFFAGITGLGEERRALIRFDVAAAIPPGSTIHGAQLVLFMSKSLAGPHDIELHRVLASWGEGTSNAPSGEGSGAPAAPGDATWTDRFHPGTPWAAPGGDFDPLASASLSVSGVGSYTWPSTPAAVADVQSWLSSPSQNHGWLVFNTDAISIPSAKRFDSRTTPIGTRRPRLVVDYSPPAPPQGFCFGDGTGTACPCGNAGGSGHGCANSLNAAGASLTATGLASLSADSLVLHGAGMPDSTALYFQGTAQVDSGLGAVFGDGLRCAGGFVTRLGMAANAGGASQHPSGAALPISVRGAILSAGTVRHYQCWYRNAAAFCTSATHNLTNGLTVTWGA